MKVKALIGFNDLKTGISRKAGEEFEVTKERYEELVGNKVFGKLVEAIGEIETKPATDVVETKTIKKPRAKKTV